MEDYVKLILAKDTDIEVVDDLINELEYDNVVLQGRNDCVLVDNDDLFVIIQNFNENGISYEITDAEQSDFLTDEDFEDDEDLNEEEE